MTGWGIGCMQWLGGTPFLPSRYVVIVHDAAGRATPKKTFALPREVAYFRVPVFTAHEVNEVLVKWIPEMVSDGRSGKPHEVSGADFVLLVTNLGNATPCQDVKKFFLMFMRVVYE
jgi:hypothetical protein